MAKVKNYNICKKKRKVFVNKFRLLLITCGIFYVEKHGRASRNKIYPLNTFKTAVLFLVTTFRK